MKGDTARKIRANSELSLSTHCDSFLIIEATEGDSYLESSLPVAYQDSNSVRTYVGSSLNSASHFLQSVIAEYVVVMHAFVKIQYQGRASSTADLAPRIIITKPDGTLLIHDDSKSRPVNWQPPGTKFDFSVQGSTLVLEAFRRKDNELLIVSVEKMYFIAASKVRRAGFELSGSESDMVDEVVQNPSLIEQGFVPEKREFRTPHGNVDLVGHDKDGNVLLLEFKRRQAQLSSASQLDRYVNYFVARGDGTVIRGGLVAPSLTKETGFLLANKGYEFFELKPNKVSSILAN